MSMPSSPPQMSDVDALLSSDAAAGDQAGPAAAGDGLCGRLPLPAAHLATLVRHRRGRRRRLGLLQARDGR